MSWSTSKKDVDEFPIFDGEIRIFAEIPIVWWFPKNRQPVPEFGEKSDLLSSTETCPFDRARSSKR